MQVFDGHLDCRGRAAQCSVAIGNFDGVHNGHRTLINAAAAVAHQGPLAVLTFNPHPAKVLKPTLAPQLIVPFRQRLILLEKAGVEVVVVEPFSKEFASLSAEAFVDEVLLQGLQPQAVTVGYDFTYGAKRTGSVESLHQRLSNAGVEVRILAPIRTEGVVVSSTKVREFVLAGQVEGAAMLLGRLFSVSGQVIHGAGRGAGMGIKTLNLETDYELLPRRGVYATWTRLLGSNQVVSSVTNVGRNPTFGDEDLHIETHVLEDIDEQYGLEVEVLFVSRLRDEKRFPDAASLVAQIGEDIRCAKAILGAQEHKD